MQPKLHYSGMTAQSLPWAEPLALASGLKDEYWALLYSSAQAGYSGRYSYLAWDLAEHIEADDFLSFEHRLTDSGRRFDPAWFGYLGYGLRDCLEQLTPEPPNFLSMPNLHMMRFHAVCEFDHAHKTLTLWSDRPVSIPAPSPRLHHPVHVSEIRSNMTRAEYLKKVKLIVDRIHAGDLYQANLTRKFRGEFTDEPDDFVLFTQLCEVSPAPYSVFMRLGTSSILSSSPERFLHIDAEGSVITRPIKGTAKRKADAKEDEITRQQLATSHKDRAENLMIVDLMRNDLSRTCLPGSIETQALFEVTTHPTIHHMSSTIVGKKRPDTTTLDVVKQCFPPGSMTGAPKIRAMNLCAELEPQARGVYSGAIGWFGGDGSCDLSVVIRTLVLQGTHFEFQVGGGIVADSNPEAELAETFSKARGLLLALSLSPDALADL